MLPTIKKRRKRWRLNDILPLNEMKFGVWQISQMEMYWHFDPMITYWHFGPMETY